jgi:hypothetical protein
MIHFIHFSLLFIFLLLHIFPEILQLSVNIHNIATNTKSLILSIHIFILCILVLILNAYVITFKIYIFINYIKYNYQLPFRKKIIYYIVPIITSQILFIIIFTTFVNFNVKEDYLVFSFISNMVIGLYEFCISFTNIRNQNRNNSILPISENDNQNDNQNVVEIDIETKSETLFENVVEISIDLEKEIDCCICLEKMNIGIKLNCNHIMHKECLKKWYSVKKNCPLCRKNDIII